MRWPGYLYQFSLFSFAELRTGGVLAAVGRAFDTDPRLRPDRIDTRDPIRNKVTSAESYFEEHGARIAKGFFLFDQRRAPHLAGMLDAPSYTLPLPDAPHTLEFSVDEFEEPWLREPEHLEAVARLFVTVAGAFDAAWGFATDSRMWRQHDAEMARAGMEAGTQFPTMGPLTDRYTLRDVYWLNYFGPAFVEQWADRLACLGVRQEPTPNGGVVIWATETPFVFRDGASFMEYPWKQPFYDLLGRDTFYHPRQPPGQYVPTRDDHIRHLRSGGAADQGS